MKNILYVFILIACSPKIALEQRVAHEDKPKTMGHVEGDTLKRIQKKISFPPERLEAFDFSSIEAQISDSLKLELLERLVFNKYLLSNEFTNSKSYDFENYHVLDINSDEILDVIYDGRNPSGIETNNVVFFLNQGDSLRPLIKLNGDFTKLEIKDNQLQRFQLVKSPCCANFIYRIEDYEYKDLKDCFEPQNGDHEYYKFSYGQLNEPEFCVSMISQYAYVINTKFPDSIESIRKSSLSKKAFISPRPLKPSNTDFKEEGIEFYDMYANKAIAKLAQGMECQILAEEMDDKGQTYCFIVFSNREKEDNYMSNIDFEQYAWINKNKLSW